MARSKRNKNLANQVKPGRYKRDHSYIDISDDDDSLYEDDRISEASSVIDSNDSESGSSHERFPTSASKDDEVEQDFISLNTEVDNRSRQERRSQERANLKRKRVIDAYEDADDPWESQLCYPWMDLMSIPSMKKPLSAVQLLQREVNCFIQYLEPTKIEIKMREYLVHRITRAVQAKWPKADVLVFGSFSTQLYLPNSDIDLVVTFPPSTQVRLRRLASVLEAEEICRDPHIIENASVPVIKFEDMMTKLKVDIILNSTSGVESAKTINDMLIRYPGVRPIALIVKHLLALRSLNEVFTGGLGGYAIVCLVVSFLQMHPKVASGAIDPIQNIGVLLLDFFQLYGLNFNLEMVGINVNYNGSYYDKSRVVCRNGRQVFSIRDPQDANNDIGMKSYNSSSVIRAFKFAYLSMTSKAFELEEELRKNGYKHLNRKRLSSPKKTSILSSFLHISSDFMKQRQLMNDVYAEKRWKGQEAADSFPFDQE